MMHPVDRAAAILTRRGPGRLRVFPDGWGDHTWVDAIGDTRLLAADPPPLEISWTATRHSNGCAVTDGTFPAPTDLPPASRSGAVRIILPDAGTERLCLLVAAWNDHGYSTRGKLATELVDRGVGSLILENPYYGTRRVTAEGRPAVPTVADFARMGLGAVTEGRALLAHFRTTYRLGVSGYSMGGNISALIGAAAGFPVAIAPLAASHSPGPVFLDGVISNGVRWGALGGRDQEPRLRAALSSVSVLHLPAPDWTRSAVLVAGRSDGFVPRSATEALHAHWPGSALRLCRGGHATLLWRRRDELADAIVDSFERFESA
jgi:hypothetical protein